MSVFESILHRIDPSRKFSEDTSTRKFGVVWEGERKSGSSFELKDVKVPYQ